MAVNQPYEGATASPRGHHWNASGAGPNVALAASGATLRNRSRHGYRNSCLLRSAINKGVTSEVGKGITILSTAVDEEVRATLNRLWKEHQNFLDPWGAMTWGGLLAQASRARKTAGEVFIRRVRTPIRDGHTVPLQLEVLEAEFCPMTYTRRIDQRRRIVQGVEFIGRRKVAYWFHKSHPSDLESSTFGVSDLVRVPARDVIHHYNPTRPGQIRGEPDTAAALLKDREFADYSDAELNRKKTRSAFTGFLYREGFTEDDYEFDPQTGRALYDDSEAPQQSEEVAAGTILRGVAGEKLQLFEGDNTGSGFKDFVKWQAQQLAAALDIPYQLLTGDWDGLSDRTIRAIMNEYRRGVTADQRNLLGFQVCLKVWAWFVETCISVGFVSAPGYASDPWRYFALDIRPDAWRHLHPEQDIRSRSMAIKNLFSNPEAEAAECGGDLEENMRATARTIKRWREICDAEGLDPDAMGIFGAAENDKETDE
ncbi:MAG: phage portal protein [Aeromonas sp.]